MLLKFYMRPHTAYRKLNSQFITNTRENPVLNYKIQDKMEERINKIGFNSEIVLVTEFYFSLSSHLRLSSIPEAGLQKF